MGPLDCKRTSNKFFGTTVLNFGAADLKSKSRGGNITTSLMLYSSWIAEPVINNLSK
jgi:hypothetical protein